MPFPKPELLLHSLIPPPLHGLAPRSILGVDWWNEQRHRAKAANMFKCWACNIPERRAKLYNRLEGHENYAIDWKNGTCSLTEIVSLCHYCHNYIHRGRLEVMLAYGKVKQLFVDEVIQHGDRLTSHLSRPTPIKEIAPWDDWVLLIDGKAYPSRFTSEREWATYYDWINRTNSQDSEASLKLFKPLYNEAIAKIEQRSVTD